MQGDTGQPFVSNN